MRGGAETRPFACIIPGVPAWIRGAVDLGVGDMALAVQGPCAGE